MRGSKARWMTAGRLVAAFCALSVVLSGFSVQARAEAAEGLAPIDEDTAEVILEGDADTEEETGVVETQVEPAEEVAADDEATVEQETATDPEAAVDQETAADDEILPTGSVDEALETAPAETLDEETEAPVEGPAVEAERDEPVDATVDDKTETVALEAQATSSKKSISGAKVTISGKSSSSTVKVAWTGKRVTPKIVVKLGSKTLRRGTDYTLFFKNNMKAGATATVTITGKGGYKGTKTIRFKIGPKTGTWIKSGSKWWYRYRDGSYPKSKIVTIDGAKYHFDASGWMSTGWVKVSGSWYHFADSGIMDRSKWIDGTYYVGKNGVMLTNTVTPDGYRVGSDGRWDGKGKVATAKTVRVGGTSPYKITLPAVLLQNGRSYNSSSQKIMGKYTLFQLDDHSTATHITSFYQQNKGRVDFGLVGTRKISGVGTLTIYEGNDYYYTGVLVSPKGKKMAFTFIGASGQATLFGSDNASWERALRKVAGVSASASNRNASIQFAVAIAKKVKFQ